MAGLALILDSSESYINFQKQELLKKWNLKSSDVVTIERLAEAGGVTLFGDSPCSLISPKDSEDARQLVSDLNEQGVPVGGLIIVTDLPGNTTKKLRDTVTGLGGEIFALTPEAKKDKSKVSSSLLKDLNLNSQVKDFLIGYIGDDYESLLGLVRTLGDLTPEQQFRVTEEDVFIRLPQPPGAVPPWKIEQPLLRGNLTEVVDIYRRSAESSSPLVILAILNNKFRLSYRVAAILADNPRIAAPLLAKALSVPNNYPLKLAMESARKHGRDKLQQVVDVLATVEADMKGNSAVNPISLMEVALIKIALILRATGN